MQVLGFRAHRAGVQQNGIPSNLYTRVSFTSPGFDDGAGWDYSEGVWRPPAGLIEWSGQVYIFSGVSGINGGYVVKMHKNGADITAGAGGVHHIPWVTAIPFSGIDRSDGRATYELKLYATSTDPAGCVIDGNPAHTWLCGKVTTDKAHCP